MRSCARHLHEVLDDEGGCRECEEEALRQYPEMAPLVRRSRRWRKIYAVYATVAAAVSFALYWGFMLYREHVIWTR